MKIFGDMVASELRGLSCSILKVKFKHEVNNLIFKYQMLNLQQNAQPNTPSNLHPLPFSLQLLLLRAMAQYSCRARMEEVSIVTIQALPSAILLFCRRLMKYH